MWNYSFVIPDFLILFTFLAYYFVQPKLSAKLNKAFLNILFVDLFTLIIDVVASITLEYYTSLSPKILIFFNTAFFLLFIHRNLCFFKFSTIILNIKPKLTLPRTLINFIPYIFTQLFILYNLSSKYLFSISESGHYSRGPFYGLIYFSAFYYTALSIFYIFISRKQLAKKDFIATLCYNLVLFAGYTFRILYPNYLLMNLFSLIAIIIIFLSFENPSVFLDEKTGIFNKKALSIVLKEIKSVKAPMIIGFAIHNYNDLREIYSNHQTDIGLSLIGKYLLKSFPKHSCFYLRNGRFVIIGKDNSRADFVCKEISKRFDSPWNAGQDADMYFEVSFVKIKPDTIYGNKDALLSTLSATLKDATEFTQDTIIIEESHIQLNESNIQIKREVENSVENNSVELFLQPLVDTENHKLIGAEALARIRNSEGQLIPPVKFIPIAERNGRINMLGEQMFEKTCQFISEHDIEAMGLSWINVNLSPLQFLRKDLNSRFTGILEKYKVSAEKIHLEITEESMIDYALLQKQIQIMKASGFQFVLDDYGSGYSNVSRLKRCPFINVKLDMELVWDYFSTPDKILPTLVQTFKEMNFTVTAEGIETLEMATAMKNIGCDYLQGYCFSKPLPAKEFAEVYGR